MCKRISAVLLALLLSLCLTSASFAEAADTAALFGTLDGDVYVNSAAGFTCTLPGWHFYSEEEISAFWQNAKASFAEAVSELLEQGQTLTVMFAEAPDGMQNANIGLQQNDLLASYIRLSGVDAIQDRQIGMTRDTYQKLGYNDIEIEKAEITIGGIQYPGLRMISSANGRTAYQYQVTYACGSWVGYFTYTSFEEDLSEAVLPAMSITSDAFGG